MRMPGSRFGHTSFEVSFMKKKSSRAARISSQVPRVPFRSADPIASDVQGSYTGVPRDGGEPVQDADDL